MSARTEAPRRRRHAGVRRPAAFASVVLGAAAFAVACTDLLVSPAPPASAALALSFAVVPDTANAGDAAPGIGAAFDKADGIRIRVQRGGTTILDVDLGFTPAGAETRVRVELDLEEERETLDVALELRSGGQPLFEGGATVTVEAASTTEARIDLVPIPAGVRVPETVDDLEAIGQTIQLTGDVVFATGDPIPGLSLTWSTEDTNVVSVTSDGRVTAVAQGVATVVGAYAGHSGAVSVRVQQRVVSVDVTPATATVDVGQTLQLTASPRDANGNVVPGRPAAWSSLLSSIASVDGDGLVTGVAPGTVSISATVDGVTGQASVTVVRRPVAAVAVEPESATLLVGETVQLTATPLDAAGAPLTGRTITWASTHPEVAIVNATGLVTALSNGHATIRATVEGVTGTAAVTVGEPARIHGTVYSGASSVGMTVAGATVEMYDDAVPEMLVGTATTDEEGDYEFENVQPGTYTLIASAEGYEPATAAGVEVGASAEIRVDFELNQQPFEFDEQFLDGADNWIKDSGNWFVVQNLYFTPGEPGQSPTSTFNQQYTDFEVIAVMLRQGCQICANRVAIRAGGSVLASGMLANWYSFQYNNNGQVSVRRNLNGVSVDLLPWTTTGALTPQTEEWTELRVRAFGSTLSFYVNDVLVWSGNDDALTAGRVGVGMDTPIDSTGEGFWVDRVRLTFQPTPLPSDPRPPAPAAERRR